MPLLAGILFAVTGLTACSDNPVSDDDDNENNTPEVTAVFTFSPSEPVVGETVNLDAGSSSTTDGTLEYSWSLSAPTGSDAEIDTPESATASFDVDVAGNYEITLSVKVEGVSDSASETVRGVSPVQEISGSISEDTTFPAYTSYRVIGDVNVNNGAKLTIEPGVLIEFEAETSIEVSSDARLVAEGTEQDSIIFTGTEKQAGWWDGIYVQNTTHPDNRFDYVVVEYGGGGTFHSSVAPANLVLGRSFYNASLSVTNSTFRYSGGFGLFIHTNGNMPQSSGNTYTLNTGGPATVFANAIHYLDDSSSFTGNEDGTDFVQVLGNTLSANAVWQSLDVPYAVNSDIIVKEAELTIEAGARFAFEAQTGLTLQEGSITRALGTESDPVVFTGLQEQPGWWNGIYFNNTTHPDNLLEYVIVEYGGNEAFHSSTEPANLTLGRTSYSATVAVKNSIFRNSGGVGLYAHANGSLEGSESNTYTGNSEGPVSVPTSRAHYLDSGSSFTGNADETNYAFVRGNRLEEDVTWQPLDVPYGMQGISEVRESELIIEPGSELAFDNQARLEIRPGSIIQALGTEEDRILFTGTREQAGWWDGIFVYGTEHPDNALDYVTIEYGGRTEMHSSIEPANLSVGRTFYPAYLSVTNSIIRNSNDVGIYVHDNSAANDDVCSENTFNGNGGNDCTVN